MLGPIIILDKSAFQSFSHIELVFLRKHFHEILTPILVSELLGDLTKKTKNGKRPEDKVVELAKKFSGGGPKVTMNYMYACIANLLGAYINMDGRPIIDYAKEFTASDGSRGAIIDLHPFNEALLRWQRGNFSALDKQISELWRLVRAKLSVSSFKDDLNSRYVIVPRAKSVQEIKTIADDLLNKPGLQDVWIDWITSQLVLPANSKELIKRRWEHSNTPIYNFAPYVYHCLRVMMCLQVAIRSDYIKWDYGHIFDIQYLYYLPFCAVFCSNDSIHRILAPMLMRDNQSFISGQILKSDLRRLSDQWEAFTDQERKRYSAALGSYPPPSKDSPVFDLWNKHIGSWKPESRIRSDDLTDEQFVAVVQEFAQRYEELKDN